MRNSLIQPQCNRGALIAMPIIYHLTTISAWEASASSGEVHADSLAQEGFIHCSENQEQMLRVANRLFAGQDNLLALEVDTERLTAPLKREPSRSGEIYPHIYGVLPRTAVVGHRRLLINQDGQLYRGD